MTKNKIILAFVLTLFSFRMTYGCLNGETLILKNGLFIYEDFQGRVPHGHSFESVEEYEAGLKELDGLYKKTKDLDYLSDKGILFILLGQYDKAIALYLEIEKIAPNRYSTASNIGTAYELAGQNSSALEWIKRAIEIDSSSHHSSEWIHAKILEAKIKGEKYYVTDHLLNTDFGDRDLPSSDLTEDELNVLASALYYQLNERISFVKPKEKIVAQLLFDLGNVEFLLRQYKNALEDYNRAKEYGFEGPILDTRMKLVESKKNPLALANEPITYFREMVFGIILVAFVGFFIYKRRRAN